MAPTYTLIQSQTLVATAATVSLNAIPSTYTDLVLKWSVRDTNPGIAASFFITINSDTTNNSYTYLRGTGASAQSNYSTGASGLNGGFNDGSLSTANTFSNGEMYLPNYALTTKKPASVFNAQEDNSSTAFIYAVANLNSGTAAVTSLTLNASVLFSTGSSFYLYGISNA
jgi:hypothetical protein